MRQLVPVDMVAPGSQGLNLEAESNIIDYHYATVADNAVIDTSGRLAARRGYTVLTTTPIGSSPPIKTLFEYRKGDGTVATILAWDGGISTSVTNPVGGDISGAVTDTNGDWYFQNFNDKAVGFQSGKKPIVWTGAGNFATVVESSGTAPSGGIGACVFGRVWSADTDLQTIKYSGLLDETNWGGSGSGTIDMRKVWTQGTDSIKAIASFNGLLVVFGKKHVVFWTDGGSTGIGLDPSLIYVHDVVAGTGALSQKTVLPYGDADLFFVAPSGVQRLSRVIIEKSNPLATMSKNVRAAIISDLGAATATSLRAVYSPEEGLYIVSLGANRSWVVNKIYADPVDQVQVGIMTRWTLAPTSMLRTEAGNLYIGGAFGVAQYTGGSDNGSSIAFEWKSGWLDFGTDFSNYEKILKRFGAILFAQAATTLSFKWWIDFADDFSVLQDSIAADGSALYGIAEYGVAEYSGALSLRQFALPARGTGQYFRIGISAGTAGTFAIQQANLLAKQGRLA